MAKAVVVATLMKVGQRGYGGDYVTLETMQDALRRHEKTPVEGVQRLWLEGDELKAEVEVDEAALGRFGFRS